MREYAPFVQGLVHPGVVGSERPTALKNEGNAQFVGVANFSALAGRFKSFPQSAGFHVKVALVRAIIRQIAMEHELEIISRKIARDHVTRISVLPPAPGYQSDCAVVKGHQLMDIPSGVPSVAEEVLGPAFLGEGIFWQ